MLEGQREVRLWAWSPASARVHRRDEGRETAGRPGRAVQALSWPGVYPKSCGVPEMLVHGMA